MLYKLWHLTTIFLSREFFPSDWFLSIMIARKLRLPFITRNKKCCCVGTFIWSVFFLGTLLPVFAHGGFYIKNSKSAPRMGRSMIDREDPMTKIASFCRYLISLDEPSLSSPHSFFKSLEPSEFMTPKPHFLYLHQKPAIILEKLTRTREQFYPCLSAGRVELDWQKGRETDEKDRSRSCQKEEDCILFDLLELSSFISIFQQQEQHIFVGKPFVELSLKVCFRRCFCLLFRWSLSSEKTNENTTIKVAQGRQKEREIIGQERITIGWSKLTI